MSIPADLAGDIAADLITTNELGVGERDYREEDGVLYIDLYDGSEDLDDNGIPICARTFRIDISITEESN